jgi:hypothetical protein
VIVTGIWAKFGSIVKSMPALFLLMLATQLHVTNQFIDDQGMNMAILIVMRIQRCAQTN